MRYRSFIALSCVAFSLGACGDLEEKASSKTPNSSNAENSSNSNSANASNSANSTTLPDDLMATFGTEGPIDFAPKSTGGNARCDLDAIRTDDLGDNFTDEQVPPQPWDSSPVAGAPARCGDDLETGAWRLMNCERLGQSLAPLQCDMRLVWLGRAHGQDMVFRGFFDHDNPDGETPFDRMSAAGIGFGAAAENIALNPSVEGAHFSWMDSPGHRENIMSNQWSVAGIGYYEGHFTTGFSDPG